mmetsp:Transcript_26301/g.49080  ORF Transcript_26301/g.49080 Transcript_26301/m.49080 type:complete len:112 (+) Transcript_26301:284-619(+)|eukprot:CAMPEP_0178755826 /NCGR_PEP_ID=MMETSP0744-20121128/12938_1 /TAXON_ID=913974 /ORGANISM="Nitzschia punctata, Strain CCMP561" /LENGTH=111 /DNA_ID=CAMNT_0020409907 /DNA_START=172 /DNA_END=507 /DNA_ORIENTATION=+
MWMMKHRQIESATESVTSTESSPAKKCGGKLRTHDRILYWYESLNQNYEAVVLSKVDIDGWVPIQLVSGGGEQFYINVNEATYTKLKSSSSWSSSLSILSHHKPRWGILSH